MTPGTVLITGPTGGLGRETTLALARRPAAERPDLVLVGRAGEPLGAVASEARAHGAVVHDIGADLARLSDVRAAASTVSELVAAGQTRPLCGLIGNAGLMSVDTHTASADGYELTFAVNYLAHAQLIDDLRDQFSGPARIVLVGSNTYHQNIFRKMLRVAPAHWRDPIEMARPLPAHEPASMERSGIAYSDSKLAILYYAHELERHLPDGVTVAVFEPGFMPGTGLSRAFGGPLPAADRTGHPGDPRRLLTGAVGSAAGLGRRRRPMGSPERRSLCRQERRAAGAAVRPRPHPRTTALGSDHPTAADTEPVMIDGPVTIRL
ncbi:SDR family NAD(P)-dependent oxidoreductase [Mycolicibacterium sp. 120266]|uniref:SDR family NAD(P)-dependent oxidoreductase n=1 Tax=Mycolicibacterium sp. 120266 TaxID=3090601 RepID=UPI00299CDA02|nr:SDR family NAD(P)-dependent oxidoreductase [Mycolicibacterium sp. 120266]MDX1874834.1 SDR family NAD(P)-dependent oxidoreductase [Mycolicibacterium sp. 120266]